jgi:hypothetical protein
MSRDNIREHAEFTQVTMDVPKSPQSSLAIWKSAVATFTALQAAVPSAIMLLETQKGNNPRGQYQTPPNSQDNSLSWRITSLASNRNLTVASPTQDAISGITAKRNLSGKMRKLVSKVPRQTFTNLNSRKNPL